MRDENETGAMARAIGRAVRSGLALSLALSLGLCLAEPFSALNDRPEAKAKTERECKALGGVWHYWNSRAEAYSGRRSCRLPAPDAGKVCSSSSDCSLRICKAERDAPVAEDGTVQGVCPAFRRGYGCQTRVEKGRLQPGVCRD